MRVNDQAKEMKIEAYDLRDAHGNWVLAPLLVAKAQALHALAMVNQK